MASPGFIHLNCHSAYSLLEGALPLSALVKLAAADGMPAVGVADTANLFGALEFSEKAAQAGIQPIIGCKLPVRFEPEPEFDARRFGQARPSRHVAPLTLLGRDRRRLCRADPPRHRLLSGRGGARRAGAACTRSPPPPPG